MEDEKKIKQWKPKKPKVSIAEATSKIDAMNLFVFLVDVLASYGSQTNIQLIRFADYFARAFASVSASMFSTRMFKESLVLKTDIQHERNAKKMVALRCRLVVSILISPFPGPFGRRWCADTD